MVSGKYHIGSIVAVFFALGVGIVIGGTLGQQWMFQTEQHTVGLLMDKYERQIDENRRLREDEAAWAVMRQAITPVLEDKRVWWVRPEHTDNALLPQMMAAAKAQWTETRLRRPEQAAPVTAAGESQELLRQAQELPEAQESKQAGEAQELQQSRQSEQSQQSQQSQESQVAGDVPDLIVISDLDEALFRFIRSMLEGQSDEYTQSEGDQ